MMGEEPGEGREGLNEVREVVKNEVGGFVYCLRERRVPGS
jgi:hypothetical protein